MTDEKKLPELRTDTAAPEAGQYIDLEHLDLNHRDPNHLNSHIAVSARPEFVWDVPRIFGSRGF